MAAPKGNKYAAGANHRGGPPLQYDLEAEAKALLQYAQKATTYSIIGFGPTRGYSTDYLYQWAERHDVVAQAFDQARQIIAARLMDKLIQGKSNPAVFARYIGFYDRRLAAHERELKRQDNEGIKQITIQVRGLDTPSLPLEQLLDVDKGS